VTATPKDALTPVGWQGALRDGKKRLKEERGMEMELSMCNFDWHRLRKELGMPLAVCFEALFAICCYGLVDWLIG
jgi:hypothetical protein